MHSGYLRRDRLCRIERLQRFSAAAGGGFARRLSDCRGIGLPHRSTLIASLAHALTGRGFEVAAAAPADNSRR
jgi:hypothetical protein